jgi:hypothetical protein
MSAAPYGYTVHFVDGASVAVDAVAMQIDDSGTLGLFNADGHMTASWVAGDWKLCAPSSEPKPEPVAAVVEAPAAPVEAPAAPVAEPQPEPQPEPAATAPAEPHAEPHAEAPAEPPAEHAN